MLNTCHLDLDREAAANLLGIESGSVSAVQLISRKNHIWRVTSTESTFFVKAHTKDWYQAMPADPIPVRHEVSGYRALRAEGLPAPEVVAHSTSRQNSLGWPYLITRALSGSPLIDWLYGGDARSTNSALRATGRYLAAMHSITFEHPGYLIDGPPDPPDPHQWLHWLSSPERFLLNFSENIAAHRNEVDFATHDAIFNLLRDTLPCLDRAYQPLKFVHGDCHANVFFIDPNGESVSGIIDMENCSAGAPEFDFVKLFIELAGHFSSSGHWWKPLFDGYGSEPDFDLIRLLLVGHSHVNYTCFGKHSWPGGRSDILHQIVESHSWGQLFDIRPAIG